MVVNKAPLSPVLAKANLLRCMLEQDRDVDWVSRTKRHCFVAYCCLHSLTLIMNTTGVLHALLLSTYIHSGRTRVAGC